MAREGTDILCYTRMPQDEQIYSAKLAYSMHLACRDQDGRFQALNHNSGVLFAKATENENGSLNAKCLKNPYLFYLADGTFGVVAVRTEPDGSRDEQSKGRVLLFVSSDLLQYTEVGLIDLKQDVHVSDVKCRYDDHRQSYVIDWCDDKGNYYRNVMPDLFVLNGAEPEKAEPFILEPVSADIEGIVPRNVISVAHQTARRLMLKLTVPVNVRNEVPAYIHAASQDDLKSVKATAVYTDGTTAVKPVDWDAQGVDWSKPGTYRISGTIRQDLHPFPFTVNRADPCIARWNGKYYFIATNDADGNHTFHIREADTIPGLRDAKEALILDSGTYADIKGLLWAPELHVIEDDLYLFHGATSGEFFYEEAHVMKLRRGGNPTVAADWSRPMRVVKKDGTHLCEAGKTISLDMTVIRWDDGEYYAVWSQREFVPADLGAWLYIAKIDPKEPWKLTTDPVVLSKPEYSWANNHTFVDEGPYALMTEDKLFLTFSSALVDATYAVGLLTADRGADLLDPVSWTKGNYPILTSRSVPGQFGPGHNCYVTDDDGVIWNVFHARTGVDGPRCSGIRRVHWDIDGCPRLDLTEEKDLDPVAAKVTMDVIVK